MDTLIAHQLRRFKDGGDIGQLLRLDELPPAAFESIQSQLRTRSYLSSHAAHSLDFTCYQHSMACALDKFHPGIVAYIAQEFPSKLHNEEDHFVRILNEMLAAIEKRAFTYASLLGMKKDSSLTDEQMIRAIHKLEAIIADGRYLFALGDFHGELYRFTEHDGRTTLTLLKQSSAANPILLWERGMVEAWCLQDADSNALTSNENIIVGDLRTTFMYASSFTTKFFGREQIRETFTKTDLRKLVKTIVKDYRDEAAERAS